MGKVVAVDIQGFNLPDFCPKEITFISGCQYAHYLLTAPTSYISLSDKDKKQVKYLERYHHGLKYNSGYVQYSMLDDILRNHLQNVDLIYVKGHQKLQYLERKMCELKTAETSPTIINVESWSVEDCAEPPPKFIKDTSYCFYHCNCNAKYMCSLRNCIKLYNWLYPPSLQQ